MRWRLFSLPALALLMACTCPGWLPAQVGFEPNNGYAPYTTMPGDQMVTVSTSSFNDIMRRLEALESAQSAKANDKAADGWTDVTGQKWSVKMAGRVMGDYVMYPNQTAGSVARFGNQENYFEMRRMRLEAQGTGWGVYEFKLELEFEPANSGTDVESYVQMRDVYVGINEIPFFGSVLFGNHKEPFSLEELTSSRFITFLERALPNVFAPGRHVGVGAFNNSATERLIWGYGIYFNNVDQTEKEQVADRQGVDLAGRAVWLPYYCDGGRYLLHLAAGIVLSDPLDGQVRWQSRPETHLNSRFVDSGQYVDVNDYYTANFEAALNWGRASLQGELFYDQVRQAYGAGSPDFYGAYAQATYFLTGENRVYKSSRGMFDRVVPFTNFWIVDTPNGREAGWGAWELAARWSYLDLSQGFVANSGTENDMTLGLNWYWNPNVAYKLNWIHAWNQYNTAVAGFDKAEADIISMRLQFDF